MYVISSLRCVDLSKEAVHARKDTHVSTEGGVRHLHPRKVLKTHTLTTVNYLLLLCEYAIVILLLFRVYPTVSTERYPIYVDCYAYTQGCYTVNNRTYVH
jgi:hypothetical protein